MEVKAYVQQEKARLKEKVSLLKRPPMLSIITVGHDAASEVYVHGKTKDAAEVGIKTLHTKLDESTSEAALLNLIHAQNADEAIDGIIVQLPLPRHIDKAAVNLAIDPRKDVDGFTPSSRFVPCTPKGIIGYFASEGCHFQGKNAVVIGRSQIVGKPMAKLLLSKDCNVTVLHSKTSEADKRFFVAHADILVVAVGHQNIIDSTYQLKSDAWIADVGINRDENGKVHGDCEPGLPVYRQTPVPGGVGLLTRLSLLKNLLEAYSQ